MNTELDCGKKELLVTYLYDEASPTERTMFEHHLTACLACRTELQAFRGVREDLSTWQMPFVPHIEVVTPRTALDALRDFFRLTPSWFKWTSGLATAAAAAFVLLALTGTGSKEITPKIATGQSAASPSIPVNSLTRAEAEQMIQAAVAQAQAHAQQQTQLQLARLETKLTAAHQAQLQTATVRLRQEHQRRLQIELAKFDNGSRQTVTEWLLADTNQEAVSNEKNQ